MIIDLRHGYKHGAYGIVYLHEDRAYKLFRSTPEVPPRQTREGRREIFNRQCEAYKVAGSFAYLSAHVPQFLALLRSRMSFLRPGRVSRTTSCSIAVMSSNGWEEQNIR